MGNYIYSYITPRRIVPIHNEIVKMDIVKIVAEDVKKEEVPNEIANEIPNEIPNDKEKSIHPYLLEYGTGVVDGTVLINNNVYQYTKSN